MVRWDSEPPFYGTLPSFPIARPCAARTTPSHVEGLASEIALHDARRDVNNYLILSILRVEVRGDVVVPVHGDDNSEESAYDRHVVLALGVFAMFPTLAHLRDSAAMDDGLLNSPLNRPRMVPTDTCVLTSPPAVPGTAADPTDARSRFRQGFAPPGPCPRCRDRAARSRTA